ncbi:hypothetical protein DPEC_G00226040 [Dallia pectoralis]|uniref:Uncharacterized protein n=1 Tax=Dallia pectoralis TaxID=75939 RepID=A0ACC2G0T6_DALPE|nr:hypothetical protein DPEC_G00226040 [Dallia pectoralis]
MLIKQTVDAQRDSLSGTVSGLLAEALQKALGPLERTLSENGGLLRSLQAEICAHAKNMENLTTKVDALQGNVRQFKKDTGYCISELGKLQQKVNVLEDRGRRNNVVRLVNLPSGIEGDDPAGFLRKMLPTWIPELAKSPPLEIDRAHRIHSNNAARPRTMIFRLLRYPDRQAILQGARKAKPSLPDGTRLEFYADYSSGATQQRNAYKGFRAMLRQKGIEHFLLYPAILRTNMRGERMSFDSAKEAELFFSVLQSGGTSAVPTVKAKASLRFTGDTGMET